MNLATLLAAIAIVMDSQIIVIGAVVIGPELVPIAALELALVRRRSTLFATAARMLLVGFGVAIAFGAGNEVWGSGIQLALNIAGGDVVCRDGECLVHADDSALFALGLGCRCVVRARWPGSIT